MTHLKAEVTFSCNDKNLNAEQQAMALENLEQQALYPEQDYDEATYGKWICIFDTWMGVEDAEERNNTSLDPLFLEDWIDVELLSRVKQLHEWIKVPSDYELEHFDRLDDVMSINTSTRDRRKFAVMNNPGFRTVYHRTPDGWMFCTVTKDNSPYIRKVIWNEEWNFEEIETDDRPDWLEELIDNQEQIDKANKLTHQTKILWKAIRESREEYKKYYGLMEKYEAAGLTSYVKLYKAKGDKAYKEYLTYSRTMDKVKELDMNAENSKKQKEVETLRHMFVEFQQKCPDKYVDKVTTDDLNNKYKFKGYEVTKTWLAWLIKAVDDMLARKKYDEEHEATA